MSSSSTNSSVRRPHLKLDADFLAKQLPLFQERVATPMKQDSFKFATNAPASLQCPPLFPGEVVELQQHRVVCVDCFPEAAVGSLYLTNYRLIFSGNSISEPDSYEVLRDIHQSCSRREMVVPEISKPRFLNRTPSAPMETFTSHINNPDDLLECPAPVKGSTGNAASVEHSSLGDISTHSPNLFNRFRSSMRHMLPSHKAKKRPANTSPGRTSSKAVLAAKLRMGPRPKAGVQSGSTQSKQNGPLLHDDEASLDSVSVGSDVISLSPCGSPQHNRGAGVDEEGASVTRASHQDGHPLYKSSVVTVGDGAAVSSPQTHELSVVANGMEAPHTNEGEGGAERGAVMRAGGAEEEKWVDVDFENLFQIKVTPSSIRRHQLEKGEWYRKKELSVQLESDSDTDDKPVGQPAGTVTPLQSDEVADSVLQADQPEDADTSVQVVDHHTDTANELIIIEMSGEYGTSPMDVPFLPVQKEVPGAVRIQQEVPAAVPIQQEVPEAVPAQQEVPAVVPVQQEVPEAVPVQQEVSGAVPIQQEVPAAVPVQQEVPGAVPIQQEVPAAVPVQQEVPEAVPVQQEVVPSSNSTSYHVVPQLGTLSLRASTMTTSGKQNGDVGGCTDSGRTRATTAPLKPPTKPKPILQASLLQSKLALRSTPGLATSLPSCSQACSPPIEGAAHGIATVAIEGSHPAQVVVPQTTTPSVTSQATPSITSQATPSVTSQATPSVTSQATPSVTSQATPLSTPSHSLDNLHVDSVVTAIDPSLSSSPYLPSSLHSLDGSCLYNHLQNAELLHIDTGVSSAVQSPLEPPLEPPSLAPLASPLSAPDDAERMELCSSEPLSLETNTGLMRLASNHGPSVDTENEPSVDTEHEPSMDTEHEPSMDTENEPSVDTEHEPSMDTENEPSVDTENEPSVDTEHGPSVDTDRSSTHLKLDLSLSVAHLSSPERHASLLDPPGALTSSPHKLEGIDSSEAFTFSPLSPASLPSSPSPSAGLSSPPPSAGLSSPSPSENFPSSCPSPSKSYVTSILPPPGSCGAPQDPSGPSGAPQDPSGPSGAPQEPSGPSGAPQDPSGPSGDPQDPSGPSGAPQDPSGPSGAPQDPSGPCGTPQDPSGPCGTPQDPSGPSGAPQDPSGPSGAPQDPSGPSGDPQDSSSLPGTPKDLSGLPSSPQDPSGPQDISGLPGALSLFPAHHSCSPTLFEACSSSPALLNTAVTSPSLSKSLQPLPEAPPPMAPPPVAPPRTKRRSITKYKTLPPPSRIGKKVPMTASMSAPPSDVPSQSLSSDVEEYEQDDVFSNVQDMLLSSNTPPTIHRDATPTTGSPALPRMGSLGSADTLSSTEQTDAPPSADPSPSPQPPQRSQGSQRSQGAPKFSTLRPHAAATSGRRGGGGGEKKEGGLQSPAAGRSNVSLTWSPNGSRRYCVMSQGSKRYVWTVDVPLTTILLLRKIPTFTIKELDIKLCDGLLVLCKNLRSIRLFIHAQNTYDADRLKDVVEKCFLTEKTLTFAHQYRSAIKLAHPTFLNSTSLPNFFKLSDEIARWELQDSTVWAVRKPFKDNPDVCPTYPEELIVPASIPDEDIVQGAGLYNNGRIPTLCWYCKDFGVALLRGADNITARGQAGPNLHMDEALLQAIANANTGGKNTAPNRLCIFTERRSELYSSLPPDQVKTYYYHCCTFEYTENPSFRNVRHSFNRLQAMLENDLSDEVYLIALNETQWLARVSDLLHTSSKVCEALTVKRSNVLVCYESGWDRTTQIVSLAQLLIDPYYRTMDGFQVLVQKEWHWFGHPFKSRHFSFSKDKDKEDGAIFLQWVDCIWQVMQQCPSAFEFNERFLMELVDFSYSSRTGTFLANCQRERSMPIQDKGCEHMTLSSHTITLWTLLAMTNASDRDLFYNKLYSPEVYPGVISPRYNVPFLRLWLSFYRLHKIEVQSQPVNLLQAQLRQLLETYNRLKSDAEKAAMGGYEPLQKPLESVKPQAKSSGDSSGQSSDRGVLAVHKTIEHQLQEAGYDTSICKHIQFGMSIIEGELVKRGGIARTWLPRWFVLDFVRECLVYFTSLEACRNQNAPKGVIAMKNVRRVYQNTNDNDHLIRNIFCLETTERTYLMKAHTLPTMEIWMGSLQLALDKIQKVSH